MKNIKDQVNKLKELIILALKEHGEQSSIELAQRLHTPQKAIIRTLIVLNKEGIINRIIQDTKKNIGTWTIEKQAKVIPYEKPYPNFDKDHKKWINQAKQKYFT